jgi:hypothetical protein
MLCRVSAWVGGVAETVVAESNKPRIRVRRFDDLNFMGAATAERVGSIAGRLAAGALASVKSHWMYICVAPVYRSRARLNLVVSRGAFRGPR